jgi:HAD superfamily hydrolase (TIGR01509 family)
MYYSITKDMKTILVDAYNTFVIKDKGLFQDMFELLEQYPNHKIVVSNANDEQIISLGLVDLPYELFTLKHEPEKTDPEYFRLLLKHYDFSADQVVYFEHNAQAVLSAKSVGICSHHYDMEKQDLVAVKEFLDKNQ